MKSIASKLMMVGRATMLAVGLAVTLALMLGIATAALAAVPGNPFRLGQVNLINTISVLGGNTNNPMLRLINNSEGSNATALDIQVKPNRPPMTVNSSTEVRGLNVDQVDSLSASAFLQESTDRDDFFSGKTYTKVGSGLTLAAGQSDFATATCDPGDTALSGGYNFGFGNHSSVFNAGVSSGDAYSVGFRGPTSVVPDVTCADFPPLR